MQSLDPHRSATRRFHNSAARWYAQALLLPLSAILMSACAVEGNCQRVNSQMREMRMELLGERITRCQKSGDETRELKERITKLTRELQQARQALARAGAPNTPSSSAASGLPVASRRPVSGASSGASGGAPAKVSPGAAPARARATPGAEVEGGLDAEAVVAAIQKKSRRFKRCFRRARRRRPDLEGDVVLSFKVNRRGKPRRVKAQSPSIRYRSFLRCVRRALRKVSFPRTTDRRNARVRFTMRFPL